MESISSLFSSPWPWFISGFALVVLEAFAPGVLLIWIGIGAVMTGLAVGIFPDMPLTGQLVILVLSMVASVLIGLRLQARSKAAETSSLNAGLEQYVGRDVIAAQDFRAGLGRVEIDGTTYSARSDHPVKKDEMVFVRSVQDSTFIVVPVSLMSTITEPMPPASQNGAQSFAGRNRDSVSQQQSDDLLLTSVMASASYGGGTSDSGSGGGSDSGSCSSD